MGHWPVARGRDVGSRAEVLEKNNGEKAVKAREASAAFVERMDTEELAPSTGLTITVETFTSQPDDNTVQVAFRPS